LRRILYTAVALGLLGLLSAGCGAKRERAELIEFAGIVESTKQQGKQILERFNALQSLKNTPEDLERLAKALAQLVVDIDDFIKPAKRMEPRTESVKKLREQYLLIWTSLQDSMRMVLEVMLKRDPKLAASLQQRLIEKNAVFQSATERFQTSYKILMRRHGITPEEVGMAPSPPTAVPFSPSKP